MFYVLVFFIIFISRRIMTMSALQFISGSFCLKLVIYRKCVPDIIRTQDVIDVLTNMEMCMKIVFVIDSWNDGNGGVIAAKRLVKELVARGHTIRVVSTGNHKGEGYEFYQVPGFTLPLMKEGLEKMNFLFAKGKTAVLRKAFEGADLVQIQFPFFIAHKAVKVAKEMGIPVTGASHVQPQNVLGAMGTENKVLEHILTFLFNHSLYQKVVAIQSPSSFAADLLTRKGSKGHIRVISNGIPQEYHPSEARRPEWFGDRLVLLSIGRHALEKRQELLIDGVLRSKYKDNIQLLLCGKGEDTDHLKERGKELPVQPLVEYVSEEDKLLYLNTADLYVHSSVVELESLSCLEAIGCGLPALISDSPNSAASQFAMNEQFLFHMDDPDSLAEKIDYWYEHRDALQKMRQSALDMALYYRMDRCVTEMEDFFADVIAGKVTQLETQVATGHVPGILPIKPAKKTALGSVD